MIDTWDAEKALDRFIEAIPEEGWSDELNALAGRARDEIRDIGVFHECYDECDEKHVEDGDYVNGGTAQDTVLDLLRNLRMGYDIGSTEDILERLKKELEA